jgi:Ca-activated chloride channel family protein
MTLLWPAVLPAFLLVPVLVLLYILADRKRRLASIRYPSVALVAQAAAAGRPWRRHLPAVLYLATLSTMILALARPVWPLPVPDNQAAVMLSIDVSGSMISTDVWPSRIEAAKAAATEFVRNLPVGAKVGLVTFSTKATLVTPPTDDHDRVIGALKSLQPEATTAIGEGILKAVYALPGRGPDPAGRPNDPPAAAQPQPPLAPAAVVLMSDGGNNTGTDPAQAAAVARRLHVVIHTVGLGQPAGVKNPETTEIDEPLDEATLQQIASITGGTYRRAQTATELSGAYNKLGRMVAWRRRPVEVSGPISAASVLLLGGAMMLATRWRRLD